MNKYTDEVLKKYGINISLLAEGTSVPKLVIYQDDGNSASYYLSYEYIKNLQNNNTDFIYEIIDNHIKTYVKYIRKKKLLNIDK